MAKTSGIGATHSTGRTVASPKPASATTVRDAKTPTKPSRAAVTRAQAIGSATGNAPTRLKPSNLPLSKTLLDKASTWKMNSWGGLRRKLNKALAEDPSFLATPHANKENIRRMKAGKNPLAAKAEQVGKRKVMEWDHWRETKREKVDPLKVSNLRLVSPLKHIRKIGQKFHKAAGTPVPEHLRNPAKPTPEHKVKSVAQKLKKPLRLF